MACDWVSVYAIGAAVAYPAVWGIDLVAGSDAVTDRALLIEAISTVAALAVTGTVALGTGRTIGDHATRLAFRGGSLDPFGATLLRFVGGIGGYQLLTAPTEGANPVSLAFVAASIVLFFTTARGRGLPGLLSRRQVVDVRDPRRAD